MICPSCYREECRRSRRRGLRDAIAHVTGSVPWRCTHCGKRFRARAMPLSDVLYAHCGICGNMELRPIAAIHVDGLRGMIGRKLGLQALRCDPCRNKFVTVRPLKRREPEALRKVS